jgi:CheY-specific phosphatase CheX
MQEVKTMKEANKYQDIATGLFFVTGVFGFVSGAFVLSTALFGAATLMSNLQLSERIKV